MGAGASTLAVLLAPLLMHVLGAHAGEGGELAPVDDAVAVAIEALEELGAGLRTAPLLSVTSLPAASRRVACAFGCLLACLGTAVLLGTALAVFGEGGRGEEGDAERRDEEGSEPIHDV